MTQNLTEIKKYLLEKDPNLAKILHLEINFFWQPRPIYEALLETINYQQVSIHAGKSLYKRFLNCFGGEIPTPKQLLDIDATTLKNASVSAQKINYLYSIAEFASQNRLDNAYFDTLSDTEIIAYLTQIKGIGEWTVQMLLMFDLGREDVFAPADIALHWTMKRIYAELSEAIFLEHLAFFEKNYQKKSLISEQILQKNISQEDLDKKHKNLYKKFFQAKILEISAKWSPYRSWVCHFLWAFKEGK